MTIEFNNKNILNYSRSQFPYEKNINKMNVVLKNNNKMKEKNE
jgi:hypothetical protein